MTHDELRKNIAEEIKTEIENAKWRKHKFFPDEKWGSLQDIDWELGMRCAIDVVLGKLK